MKRRILAASTLALVVVLFSTKFYVESQANASRRAAGKFLLLGDVPGARKQVEWLQLLSPQHPIGLYILGLCEEIEGDRSAAIEFYEQAVDEAEQYSDLHQEISLRLGISLFEERMFDRAERVLTEHVNHYPSVKRSRAILKAIYLSQLRIPEAYRILVSQLENISDDQSMLLELLSVEDHPNADEVVVYMKDVLQDHPGQPSVILALGVACWKTGNFDQARQRLNEALALRPDDRRFKIVVAEFYFEDGLPQKSQSLVDSVPPHHDDDNYWSLRSRLAEQNGQLDDAVSYIDNALQISPGARRHLYSKARILQRQGKSDEAEILHNQVNRIATASQELLALSRQLTRRLPTSDDLDHLANQYGLAERPQIAAAWRKLIPPSLDQGVRTQNSGRTKTQANAHENFEYLRAD